MCFGRPVISAAHAGRLEFAREDGDDVLDIALPVEPALVEQRGDRLVGFGLERAQAQVLELPLQLPDAEPIGERGEQIEHLARRLLPRFHPLAAAGHQVAQRRGALRELDQHDADVLHHREQHLAQPLRLRRALRGVALRRRRADLVHPRRAGDERRRIGAEARRHIFGIERVGAGKTDQQRRAHGSGIELQAGDDHRGADRPVDQRLAVAAARVPQRSRA